MKLRRHRANSWSRLSRPAFQPTRYVTVLDGLIIPVQSAFLARALRGKAKEMAEG